MKLINLASGDPLSIRNTVEYLKEKLGSSSELVAIEPPKQSYLISIEKAKKKYGYVPTSINSVLDRFSDDLCNRFPTEPSYRKLPESF